MEIPCSHWEQQSDCIWWGKVGTAHPIYLTIFTTVPPAFQRCTFVACVYVISSTFRDWKLSSKRCIAAHYESLFYKTWNKPISRLSRSLRFFQICSVIGFPSSTQCLCSHWVACAHQNCEDHNNKRPDNIHTLMPDQWTWLHTYIAEIFTYCFASMQSVTKEQLQTNIN